MNQDELVKVVGIQNSVIPGCTEFSISDVRRLNTDKAIEMAKHIYEFIKTDTDPHSLKVLNDINKFDESERPRVVGVWFESIELYGNNVITEDDIRELAIKWGIENRTRMIMDVMFAHHQMSIMGR